MFVLLFGCVVTWRSWRNWSHDVDGVSISRGYVVMNWQLLAAGMVAIIGSTYSLLSAYLKSRTLNKTPLPTPEKCPPSNQDQRPGAADL